jgi:hypothetical protein
LLTVLVIFRGAYPFWGSGLEGPAKSSSTLRVDLSTVWGGAVSLTVMLIAQSEGTTALADACIADNIEPIALIKGALC